MELYLRSDDREERVAVDKTAAGFEVTIGNRVYRVDRVATAAGHSLIIDGRQWEATAVAGSGESGSSRYSVNIGGGAREVGAREITVLEPLRYLASLRASSDRSSRPHTVSAYMPGRVVSVLIAEGDVVRKGQGVVVLEAMKMENEIAAEEDGLVTKIHVSPGVAIETGDPLFEVAPLPASGEAVPPPGVG